MASGNDMVQDSFIAITKHAIKHKMFPLMNCFVGLRHLLRKCKSKVSKLGRARRGDTGGGSNIIILKIILCIFNFCGSFCGGHHVEAQSFLREQDKGATSVNLVQDIAATVNALMRAFVSQMWYIDNEQFYDRIAPFAWKEKSVEKRKFIAWHHPKLNAPLIAQLLAVVSGGFDCLVEIVQVP